MQNCWIRGYRRVIFEGDCKNLVDLVNNVSLLYGLYNWIREVWRWKEKFDEIYFAWVPRDGNTVADLLATRRMPELTSSICHYFVPEYIVDALHCDMLFSI